jgi:hypothetical protein
MGRLIVVNNLGCPTYKGNSAEFLVEFWYKKNTLKLRAYVGIF